MPFLVPFVMYERGKPVRGYAEGYNENAGDTVISGEAMIEMFMRGERE